MATRHLLLGSIALIKHVGWKVWDNILRKGSADLGKHRHCGHCRLFVSDLDRLAAVVPLKNVDI